MLVVLGFTFDLITIQNQVNRTNGGSNTSHVPAGPLSLSVLAGFVCFELHFLCAPYIERNPKPLTQHFLTSRDIKSRAERPNSNRSVYNSQITTLNNQPNHKCLQVLHRFRRFRRVRFHRHRLRQQQQQLTLSFVSGASTASNTTADELEGGRCNGINKNHGK